MAAFFLTETFYTKELLQQKTFARRVAYARSLLRQKPWHHKVYTAETCYYTRNQSQYCTYQYFWTRNKDRLVYTNNFTAETYTPHIFHNATLHPEAQEDSVNAITSYRTQEYADPAQRYVRLHHTPAKQVPNATA